jgi:hypothetical protein
MPPTDKPGSRPPARTAPVAPPPSPPATSSPVLDSPPLPPVRDSSRDRPPYFQYAFKNPYNLSLFLGGLGAALLTVNPLLGLVVAGGEALWMLYAPESTALRRLVWDPKHEQARTAAEAEARGLRLRALRDGERARVERLFQQKTDIQRLAAQNPSFTADLLRGELLKTDRLVEAFLDMAVTCARYEQYLGSIDVPGLDRDRDRWDKAIRAGNPGDQQVDIAKKNLAIIMKRFEKVQEIQKYLSVAKGQLDLIENSFRLLADQIVTMQSPQELSGQLDEMLDGVQAIKDSAADTEQILGSMGVSVSG